MTHTHFCPPIFTNPGLVRDSRHCNIQDLRANARIYGRMQVAFKWFDGKHCWKILGEMGDVRKIWLGYTWNILEYGINHGISINISSFIEVFRSDLWDGIDQNRLVDSESVFQKGVTYYQHAGFRIITHGWHFSIENPLFPGICCWFCELSNDFTQPCQRLGPIGKTCGRMGFLP